jgi:hypothetical protein
VTQLAFFVADTGFLDKTVSPLSEGKKCEEEGMCLRIHIDIMCLPIKFINRLIRVINIQFPAVHIASYANFASITLIRQVLL